MEIVVVANFGSVGIALEKDMKLNMMGSGPELLWGPKMKEKEDETPPDL
jgi:hypothetical protein